MDVNIRTLTGNCNYGNKLQHYALQKVLQSEHDVSSTFFYYNNKYKEKIKKVLKLVTDKRYRKFVKFDKKIIYSKEYIYKNKLYYSKKHDFYVVGSDQVWNTNFNSFSDFYLLKDVEKKKRVSYAASFGIDYIKEEYKEAFKKNLVDFKKISVREENGKEIIENLIQRRDIEVLIDPTMLLGEKEWDEVSKKPKQYIGKKYILNYFLGELSNNKKKAIKEYAEKNDLKIINLLDKEDMYYNSGPSEFLWLEKHAELICTDSFHASVFAFLYNRPFVVFKREDNSGNMFSRLETLLNKFKIENRIFNNKEIVKENLVHNYAEAYRILEEEREKSKKFLKIALKK